MTIQKPRLLFLNPEDWYFWLHWRSLAHSAQLAGFEVIVATRVNHHGRLIEEAGLRLIPTRLRRKSFNVLNEFRAIVELVSIYRRERPMIVYHCTIKPVLYGSLAAKIAGVPCVVNMVTGLGHVFVASGWRSSVIRSLVYIAYRIAFGINTSHIRVIFQNPEDRDTFVSRKIIPAHQAVLILGIGFDPAKFYPRPEPDGVPVVMFAGRLLWNKGVGELVEAVERVRRRGVGCRLALVGIPDPENPLSVSEDVLRRWQMERKAEWWGYREDMPVVLAQAALVVLPTTYGEGLPRILIEAAASARALVATNIPGCREIVRHNENGLLVPSHNAEALAEAIELLLREPALRAQMGNRGREIAMAEFSEEQVIKETLAVYRDLMGERWPQEGRVNKS